MSLSPWTEPLRDKLERDLTPIVNPRSRRPAPVADTGGTAEPAADPTGAARTTGANDGRERAAVAGAVDG